MRGIVPDQSLGQETKANGSGDEEPGLRRHRAELLALFEDSRLARLGLVDAGALRELLTGPLPPSLQFGALDQTVACEAWLRSLERVPVPSGAAMTMRLRDGVSSAETDYGIMLLDEDSGRYWNLNPTAALVLRTLLDGGTPSRRPTSSPSATPWRPPRPAATCGSCWTASAAGLVEGEGSP